MTGFFHLRATHNPHRWYLPITDNIAVGHADNLFMFGGVGLAAGVKAMEQTCGRPVVWATAQYLSYARPGSVMDLDVWTPVQGKYTSQARVIGHVGDSEILTVNAALGSRESPFKGQWVAFPAVPPPLECRLATEGAHEHLGLHSRFEIRVVAGRYRTDEVIKGESADGRMVLWIRPRGGVAIDSAMLAIMADYLPSGVANALGTPLVGNSLDNTIRFGRIEQTEWVLCDVRIESIQDGFAHGTHHMFSESGALMAIGSQSVVLRGPPPNR